MTDRNGPTRMRHLATAMLALAGLALGLLAVYSAVLLSFRMSFGLSDPEADLMLPTAVALVGVVTGLGAVRLAGQGHPKWRFVLVWVLTPAALVFLYFGVHWGLAVAEPLYLESQTLTVPATWKEHDHLAGRVVVQTESLKPYWWTLDEQQGLLAQLQASGSPTAQLRVRILTDRQGQLRRTFLERLGDIQLNRQYLMGNFVRTVH